VRAADIAPTAVPVLRDRGWTFAASYASSGDSVFVIRRADHVRFVGGDGDIDGLPRRLRATFA
jgi:hypothetical protein